jgi:hypothetical protein
VNQVEPWATYTREHLNSYKWDLNILVEEFNILPVVERRPEELNIPTLLSS